MLYTGFPTICDRFVREDIHWTYRRIFAPETRVQRKMWRIAMSLFPIDTIGSITYYREPAYLVYAFGKWFALYRETTVEGVDYHVIELPNE